MRDFKIVFTARGQVLTRYVQATSQGKAEQAIRERFPYDLITFITVTPDATIPDSERGKVYNDGTTAIPTHHYNAGNNPASLPAGVFVATASLHQLKEGKVI